MSKGAGNVLSNESGWSEILPFAIGDKAYVIRNYHGVPIVKDGIVSELYFMKDWRGSGNSMILCASIRNQGRGPIGEKVFATKGAAEARIMEGER